MARWGESSSWSGHALIERARSLALVGVLLLSACAGTKSTGPTPSLAEAYRLQDELARSAVARGDRLVGYKAAFTSEALRRAWGVAEPLSRFLLESIGGVADGHGSHQPGRARKPSPRARGGLRESADRSAPFKDAAEARGHVRSGPCSPRAWRHPGTPRSGPTLGGRDRGGWRRCAALRARPARDARGRSSSTGPPSSFASLASSAGGALDESVLSPWDTLVWLSAHLAARGVQLQPGSVVLSGSLLPPLEGPLEGRVEGVIGPLGGVSCAAR